MDFLTEYAAYITALFGFFFGIMLTWLLMRSQIKTEHVRAEERQRSAQKATAEAEALTARQDAEIRELRHTELTLLKSQGELETLVEAQRKSNAEKQALLEAAEARLAQTFKSLSNDALRASQEQFLTLARTALRAQQEEARGDLEKRRQAVEGMVKPVADSLEKVQGRIGELEKSRQGAYASLQEQIRHMAESQRGLQQETGQLVKALRQPTGRGQWGEIQLRRVVEMAGMVEYCDFVTQSSTTDTDGRRLRPDLIVKLPAGQQVIVDSKAPMDAYLDALEAKDDATREAALNRHAKQVGDHVRQLSSKAYQNQFASTPEFVVLFLPSESIFSAALSQDPGLIEKGVDQGVILATPTTLIALLRAVSFGWRQEALAENAHQISEVGRELYSRVSTLTNHFAKMGRSLNTTVQDYNKTLGSLESRVLPGAKKLEELGASQESINLAETGTVDTAPREPRTLADNTPDEDADDFEGFADNPDEESTGQAAVGAIAALRSASEALNKAPAADPKEDDFEGFAAPDDHNPIIEEEESENPDPSSAANDLRDALKETKAS